MEHHVEHHVHKFRAGRSGVQSELWEIGWHGFPLPSLRIVVLGCRATRILKMIPVHAHHRRRILFHWASSENIPSIVRRK